MKFRAKANSVPADISDLYNAQIQGSITSIDVCGQTFGEFGYGYEGGVPSYSAAMKVQKDELNLAASYLDPPSDASKAFFIVSIISMIAAAGFFLYYNFVASKLKGASSLRGNTKGVMS